MFCERTNGLVPRQGHGAGDILIVFWAGPWTTATPFVQSPLTTGGERVVAGRLMRADTLRQSSVPSPTHNIQEYLKSERLG